MKNFNAYRRYYTVVVWMNTFGLVFMILAILRANKKTSIDPEVVEETQKELKQETAKLMMFLGVMGLCIQVFVCSKLLLILSMLLITFGILGVIAQGIENLLDEILG